MNTHTICLRQEIKKTIITFQLIKALYLVLWKCKACFLEKKNTKKNSYLLILPNGIKAYFITEL